MSWLRRLLSKTIFSDNTLVGMTWSVVVAILFALLGTFVWTPLYIGAVVFVVLAGLHSPIS